MKKLVIGFMLFILLVTLVACSGDPVEGKWSIAGLTYEFKDGVVTTNALGPIQTATYKVTGNQFEITTSEEVLTYEFTLKDDTLILTENGNQIEFKRVK